VPPSCEGSAQSETISYLMGGTRLHWTNKGKAHTHWDEEPRRSFLTWVNPNQRGGIEDAYAGVGDQSLGESELHVLRGLKVLTNLLKKS